MNAWLTPNNSPSAHEARAIILPIGLEWEEILLGALLILADPKNYEQFGTLTPEQTALEWQKTLNYYLDGE